jgi:hypothetical protein
MDDLVAQLGLHLSVFDLDRLELQKNFLFDLRLVGKEERARGGYVATRRVSVTASQHRRERASPKENPGDGEEHVSATSGDTTRADRGKANRERPT